MKKTHYFVANVILLFLACAFALALLFSISDVENVDAAGLDPNASKFSVFSYSTNRQTGDQNFHVESSILTAIYEDGMYTIGEVGLASPSSRYNLDYYFRNGKFTKFKMYDAKNNEISVFINSNNYYATYTKPDCVYFYNDHYAIHYENLHDGQNSTSNPNYFETIDGNIKLEAPTRPGYKFLGWYKDSSYSRYVSSLDAKNATEDYTVYAKWTPYIDLPVYYTYTDHYTKVTDTVGYAHSYCNGSTYYYEGLDSISSMVSGHSSYNLYNTNNELLNVKYIQGDYCTASSLGIPSYINISIDPIYSVTHELNGGTLNEGEQLYNYYTSRADLMADPATPHRDGFVFLDWFLDAALTSTVYTSSFTPQDITFYAKWAKLNSITAYYSHTDFFSASTDYVDTINYYCDGYDYIYSNNINDLPSKHDGLNYLIYNESNQVIKHYSLDGKIRTPIQSGAPSYIQYDTPAIYSITYELGAEGKEDPAHPLYKYYTKRADLTNNKNIPLNDNYLFTGWYLDENFTTTYYTSEFTPCDITLYAKWNQKHFVPVYYYDSSLETPDYIEVGQSYYFITDLGEYNLGYLPDTTKQIPYYFKKYSTTSYKVYAKDGSEIDIYNLDGNMYAKGNKEIGFVRIYAHYSVKYYINGQYYFESRGDKAEQVKFPDFVTGYIGKNYDAAQIGPLSIGKDYALYIMSGWSLTDTSDITWFNKTEVALLNSDITYGALSNNYVVCVYAYMKYYGKLNSVNSDINYDKYIEATNGIITNGSLYSLDDLMQEHVTEISSDSQKTNIDKLLKYFKLDSLGSNTLNLLKKLFNGDIISFTDLWNSLFGKIIIILIALCTIAVVLMNFINLAKALRKIQS